MLVIGEVCATILLGRAPYWLQLHTDGTSIGNTKIQDVTTQIPEGDVDLAILLAPGIVLQNGETAAAISNTVCSTIESMGDHLMGLRAVMKRLHPDKLESFDFPDRESMNVRKLEGGHLSSDNSAPATSTNDLIAERVKHEAKQFFAL